MSFLVFLHAPGLDGRRLCLVLASLSWCDLGWHSLCRLWSISPGVTSSFDACSFPSINVRCRLGRSMYLKGIGFALRGLRSSIGIDGTGS